MPSLATQWFHVERIFGGATQRERRNDPEADVDWEKTDEYVRLGALATACAILEDAGRKGNDEHIQVLFEIRNALIHYGGDIALNKNTRALSKAQAYLANSRHNQISNNLDGPFFSLTGSQVRLNSNIYFASSVPTFFRGERAVEARNSDLNLLRVA